MFNYVSEIHMMNTLIPFATGNGSNADAVRIYTSRFSEVVPFYSTTHISPPPFRQEKVK